MSFGRWLLVHSFTIFLLALFMFGYVYRTELQLETAFSQFLNLDSEVVTGLPAEILTEKEQTRVVPDIKEKPEVEQKSIPDKPVNSTLVSVPTLSTMTSDKAKPKPDEALGGGNNRLFLARQAYWDKNYADAIYLYRQLIQEDRNNPDYMGELGNIYYSLNDNNNASRLYYQAALLFINLNQPERARSLIAPITAMNRELGEKLSQGLQQ